MKEARKVFLRNALFNNKIGMLEVSRGSNKYKEPVVNISLKPQSIVDLLKENASKVPNGGSRLDAVVAGLDSISISPSKSRGSNRESGNMKFDSVMGRSLQG